MKNKLLITTISVISFSLAICSSNVTPTVSTNSANKTNVSNSQLLVPFPEGYIGKMIDDLEDGNRFNSLKGTWFIYDRHSGGDSHTIPEAYSAFVADSGDSFSSEKTIFEEK